MAKEQKTTGKIAEKEVELALKRINEQIQHLIEILDRMEKRLNGGF